MICACLGCDISLASIISHSSLIISEITYILKKHSYKVESAKNAELGLEMAHRLLPDLILSDINMPIVSGFDLVKQLSSHSDTMFIPFIFITAATDIVNQRKGMILGADDYLLTN